MSLDQATGTITPQAEISRLFIPESACYSLRRVFAASREAWLFRVLPCLVSLLALAAAASAQALPEDRKRPSQTSATKTAVINVGLTGTLALARGWLGGHVNNGREALHVFLSGAAGGYGFYQAKRLIGRRRTVPGLALAYTSASVVENASLGQHPLSHLRFGPGPFDLRVRTPFAQTHQPLATVQVNAFGTASAVLLPLLGYTPAFRSGTLHFKSDEVIEQGPAYRIRARTIARTIVLGPRLPSKAWRHELIHFTQALQVGATTPHHTLSSLRSAPPYTLDAAGRFAWDVQFDWLYGIIALASIPIDYDARWSEIEAYTLTAENEDNERGGWACPPEVICIN